MFFVAHLHAYMVNGQNFGICATLQVSNQSFHARAPVNLLLPFLWLIIHIFSQKAERIQIES